ncbi:MAG: response regulator [candidate division WOR-3 bacterium]
MMENEIKKKILLVDDETDMLAVNSAILESYGYEILSAKDGMEALATINRSVPDLILLDLMIPGIDGYQICGILKHDKRYQKIPIIIVSARFSEQDQKLAKEVGADDYLTKPFEPKTLLAKITALLTDGKNQEPKLANEYRNL